MKLTKIFFSILMAMMILIGSVVPAFAANQVVCDNTGCYQITRINNQSYNGTDIAGGILHIFLLGAATAFMLLGAGLTIHNLTNDYNPIAGIILFFLGILLAASCHYIF